MAPAADAVSGMPHLPQLGNLEICQRGLEGWISSSLRSQPEYLPQISVAVTAIAGLVDDDCNLHDALLGDLFSPDDASSNHEAHRTAPRNRDAPWHGEHTGIGAVQYRDDLKLPGVS